MVKPKQKWTPEEEAALTDGVEAHGRGKWQEIRKDPRFRSLLANRTNVDLKDKWRNMKGSDNGSSRRSNARTSGMQVIDDLLISSVKRTPSYKVMIYESLSSIEDPSGTDVKSMGNFLESKYMLPANYRRSLTATLRKLVRTGDLEKVNNCYKLKGTSSGAETSQQQDVLTNNADNRNEEQLGPNFRNEVQLGSQTSIEPTECLEETVEDAACVAAYQVALAETEEGKVIKDCEDIETLAELLDESMAMLMLAEELHERCQQEGTVFLRF